MQHKGTVKLETERLILRKHVLNDAPAMYKNWASEKEVTEFLSWEPYHSIEDVQKILSEWISQYANNDFYFWTIELKDSGELVGDISVITIDPNTFSVELGYGIGSRWWGKGIVAESGKALIRFFFEEVGVNRVYAKHATGNPNSGKAMQKMGMKYEGIIRQSGRCNQGIVDEVYYSILKNEYFDSKGENNDQ
ncbi:MAG: GNAT family N-acetyltransferase [Lachnospiraceae bacterium]|nr:GNAT family N-acetyltransferase [Lachnospiraceae bacterium]